MREFLFDSSIGTSEVKYGEASKEFIGTNNGSITISKDDNVVLGLDDGKLVRGVVAGFMQNNQWPSIVLTNGEVYTVLGLMLIIKE